MLRYNLAQQVYKNMPIKTYPQQSRTQKHLVGNTASITPTKKHTKTRSSYNPMPQQRRKTDEINQNGIQHHQRSTN